MSPTDPFLYFAYGSNLKLSEIQRTCPSAERVCRAWLPGHRLTFPRKSTGRGCGVASIEPTEDGEVWGGVYRIAEQERAALESREGFKSNRPVAENAYVRENVTVFEDGDSACPLEVLTFIANPQPDPSKPSEEYLQLIFDGGREWGVDGDYLAALANTESLAP
jgi:gamma-glutamylcyclotransferase